MRIHLRWGWRIREKRGSEKREREGGREGKESGILFLYLGTIWVMGDSPSSKLPEISLFSLQHVGKDPGWWGKSVGQTWKEHTRHFIYTHGFNHD